MIVSDAGVSEHLTAAKQPGRAPESDGFDALETGTATIGTIRSGGSKARIEDTARRSILKARIVNSVGRPDVQISGGVASITLIASSARRCASRVSVSVIGHGCI
ncbi:MAG: hypothetical protein E6Q88_14300 [Lysobacteraceae bacterium]|nr:MAG: hypothetical protein E6Q88_14300 [Xanthomonadaceae bacterium]